MNCTTVERLLTEDLGSAESADLSRHLHECQHCRELYRELKSLEELSGELKNDMQAPAFFASRVCARASEPAGPRRLLALALLTTCVIGFSSFAIVKSGILSDAAVVQTAAPSVAVTGSATADQAIEPLWITDWPVAESNIASDRGRDPRYVEILVSEPSESDFIVRLPSAIEVGSNQADNEYYLRQVSH